MPLIKSLEYEYFKNEFKYNYKMRLNNKIIDHCRTRFIDMILYIKAACINSKRCIGLPITYCLYFVSIRFMLYLYQARIHISGVDRPRLFGLKNLVVLLKVILIKSIINFLKKPNSGQCNHLIAPLL